MSILNNKRLDEINNTKLLRLILRLLDYNFTVHYIRGSDNRIADSLSRYPTSSPDEEDNTAG